MKAIKFLLAAACAAAVCPATHADHHNESVDLAGVWKVTASSDQGERDIVWTFKKDDGKLKGVSLDIGNNDERELDRITVKGKQVTLEIDIEQDGNKGMIQVEAEEKSPGKLVGKWAILSDDGTEYMNGDISAAKEVRIAGAWEALSILPDGTEYEFEMIVKGDNKKLSGVIEGQSGEIELDKIKMTDKGLNIEFEFDMDGNSLDVAIKASPEGSEKLKGKWFAYGDDGNQVADGEWSAKRKKKSLAGKWKVAAGVPDAADYVGTLILEAKGNSYSGTSAADDGEAKKIAGVKSDGKSIVFSVPFEYEGNEGTITVEAKQLEDGSLKGEWVATGKDGNEWASDWWKASR